MNFLVFTFVYSQLLGCLDSFLALQPRKQAGLLLLLVYERHHAGVYSCFTPKFFAKGAAGRN